MSTNNNNGSNSQNRSFAPSIIGLQETNELRELMHIDPEKSVSYTQLKAVEFS